MVIHWLANRESVMRNFIDSGEMMRNEWRNQNIESLPQANTDVPLPRRDTHFYVNSFSWMSIRCKFDDALVCVLVVYLVDNTKTKPTQEAFEYCINHTVS